MRPTTDWQQETYNPSWDHFRQLTAPWCSLNSDKIRGTDLSISFSWSKIGPVDHRLTDMSIDDMHEQRKTSIAYLHLQSQRTFQMDEHRHNKWQLLRYRIKNVSIIVLSWSIHGILNRCIVELKEKGLGMKIFDFKEFEFMYCVKHNEFDSIVNWFELYHRIWIEIN